MRFKPLPLRIAACSFRGAPAAGRWRACREEITVRHRYFAPWRCWWWDALSMLGWFAHRIAHPFTRER